MDKFDGYAQDPRPLSRPYLSLMQDIKQRERAITQEKRTIDVMKNFLSISS